MTFLPILQRELRVRARSPANYWGRFAMAAMGVLVCAPSLMLLGPFMPPGTVGRGAFDGLIGAAFMLCCAACILTADAISSERREGTLALLLLTRVRNFDVLMGKFASNGLAALAGLVAFLPVLMLPLLAGGVTGGEALRKSVALINALFVALSIGLWASARGFERFRTARTALFTLLVVALGPPLLGLLVQDTHIGIASPLGALFKASDLEYKTSPGRYWVSLGLIQLVGWAFLFGANTWMMRSRTEGLKEAGKDHARKISANSVVTRTPSAQATSISVENSSTIATTVKCRYCGKINDAESDCCHECGTVLHPREPRTIRPFDLGQGPTPLHWLLRRQRGLRPMLWLAAIIGFFHFAFFGMVGRYFVGGFGMFFFGLSGAVGLAMSAITGSIFAWIASRFFVEARRTGELELLVTTPVGAKEIVSAQWDILKLLVRWPVAVMILPVFLQAAVFMLSYNPFDHFGRLFYVISMLLSAGNIVLSTGALCWLGLWFGLRIPGQGKVILWTVLLANGVPYVLSLAWSILYRPVITFMGGGSRFPFGPYWVLGYLIPAIAILLYNLWLLRLARSQLLHHLAGAEPLDPRKIFSFSNLLPRMANTIQCARRWPGV